MQIYGVCWWLKVRESLEKDGMRRIRGNYTWEVEYEIEQEGWHGKESRGFDTFMGRET